MEIINGKLEKLAKYLNVNVKELEQSLNSFMALDGVTTFDEAKTVYDKAPSDSELKEAALDKMLELV